MSYIERTVRTQKELDAALAEGADHIDIKSDPGVWLHLGAYDSATVSASGSAMVRAYGSATVRAYGSATVRAYGSATVNAYDSATVSATGSATVWAYDSATVSAYGSATVWAYDSATVSATGSATVWAYSSATVTASKMVAVHLHSARATLAGGVRIDHTKVNQLDAATWCDYHGVEVADGIAIVYKGVTDEYRSEMGGEYKPGSMPDDTANWRDDNECGGGLHFCPTPAQTLAYQRDATRFLRVGIALETLRPILGSTAKCKAPRVVVPCVEVDEFMREVQS